MQINFTENEKEYIEMIPFNWKCERWKNDEKSDCKRFNR